MQPLLEDVLAALAFTASFEIDPIDPTAAPIQVTLATDFAAAQFTPAGGAFVLRVGVTGSEKVVEYEPLGAARRHGCGAGTPPMSLPGESKIEVAVHDDTLSLLLLSLWEGGLLDFEVPPELLGSEAIGMLPLEDLVVTLSGMLPPALSDCNVDAQLVVHIGDLRADATLEFAGQPMTVEMYASFEAPLTLDAADGVLQMSLGEITAVELEVTVLEAEAIPFESVIATLIEENLVPTLLNTLSGGALGGIPLPSIDLSGVGGLPEGTALEIQAEGSIRQPGVTVIQGTL